MSDLYGTRTPRRPQSQEPTRKRTTAVQMGVLGMGLLGGYGLLGAMGRPACEKPPEPNTPEALAMDQVAYREKVQQYEECRRRRSSSSSSSRSSRRSGLFSSGSSKSSVSRGGFGRSGSFGG